MHTFKINGVPADASTFPYPAWLGEFVNAPDVKRVFIDRVRVGIIPAIEAKMEELGATEWYANWSGNIANTDRIGVTYR